MWPEYAANGAPLVVPESVSVNGAVDVRSNAPRLIGVL
jgi:hypothetical protein